jgi:hypothetical protein
MAHHGDSVPPGVEFMKVALETHLLGERLNPLK